MFNAFQYDKQRLNRSNLDDAEVKQMRATTKLKQRNLKLSKQYYQRVEKFVDNLVAENDDKLNTVDNRNNRNELVDKRIIDGRSRFNSLGEIPKTKFKTLNPDSIEVNQVDDDQLQPAPTTTTDGKARLAIHDTNSLLSDYNDTANKVHTLLKKQNLHLLKVQMKFSDNNSFVGTRPERTCDPAKRSNKGFRFRPTHKQRVQESQKKNSLLDGSPSKLFEGYTHEKILNLRPKEASKELAGDFKYKARSSFENVIDTFRYQQNPTASIPSNEILGKNLFTLEKPNKLNKEIVMVLEKSKQASKVQKKGKADEDFTFDNVQENSIYSNHPHTAQSLRQTTSKSTNCIPKSQKNFYRKS